MADISKINPGNGTTYTIKDASAVSNLTISGTNLTVTRRNNTTFSVSLPADEKVKVSTSTTNARFPLMAIATSSVTSEKSYQAIYDCGIVINPGKHSVAEGYNTNVAYCSHAEGCYTEASGYYSHAEGYQTTASGYYSHAGGIGTIANQEAMTAIGKYNNTNTGNLGGDYLFVVGNGTPTSSRSNAFAVTTNGITASLLNLSGGPCQDYLDPGTYPGGKITWSDEQCWIQETSANELTIYSLKNLQLQSEATQLLLNGYDSWAKLSADGNNAYITVDGHGNVLGGMGGILIDTTVCKGDVSILTGSGVVKVSNKVEAKNGFFQTSDERQKNIISDLSLEKVYDLIDKCQTIIYTLKDDQENKEQIGMIAQEIQEFFPELISEDKNGMLSLDYSRLTVIIFKVLKDLIERINKIEQKLN